MKALIAMAIHDTPENKRHQYTKRCVFRLQETDAMSHDVYLVSSGSTCPDTLAMLERMQRTSSWANVILLDENVGTARAINEAWKHRTPGQPAVKMDNDVYIHDAEWVTPMLEAVRREPRLGIVGCKRKDCWEHPAHDNPDLRSALHMLPKEPGERWLVIERVFHVMGTCQMYSPALLERIGYLFQPGLYGYDDVLSAHRCIAAGMFSAFLPHIHIDHIDPGDTPFQSWKERHAGLHTDEVIRIAAEYRSGVRPIYFNPFA
jgi:GT2 family glycosyltransferase